MGIAPGFGYGAALALDTVPTAQLDANRYLDQENMKQQQLNINKQAENRAGRFTDSIVATQQQGRDKDLGQALGQVLANGILGGGVYAPSGASAVNSALTGDDNLKTPPVSPSGNPVTYDPNGQPLDAVTGQPTTVLQSNDQDQGNGSFERMSNPISGGAKPGMPMRGGTTNPKIPATPNTYGKPGATPQPGMAPKDETLARQGKAVATPMEGDGYHSQADALEANAAAAEARLGEAIKGIYKRYSGDPNFATYTKASVQAAVLPKIAQMRANAARIRQEGDLANYMQHGAAFARSVLSHLNQGGSIDSNWLAANGDAAKKLGVDPSFLLGLHADPSSGMFKDAQGLLTPREALMRVANPSLPWTEQMKGWHEIDNMHITQQKLAQQWAKVRQSDPEEFAKFGLSMATDLHNKYQALDTRLNSALATAITGGPVKIMVNGQPQTIKLSPKTNRTPGVDWVDGMRTSKDPNDVAYYTHVLQPLYSQRSLVGTLNSFVSNMSKNSFRAKLPGQEAAMGDVEADNAGNTSEERAYGAAKGKNRAIAEDKTQVSSGPR